MIWILSLLLFADDFRESEMNWRQEREGSMKADESWLNLIGLFWIEEGDNYFGTDPACAIVLPRHSTVDRAGVLRYREGKVSFEMFPGQPAKVNEEAKSEGHLERGDMLSHNNLRIFLIERGGKLALRVRDLRSKNFLKFKELDFYKPRKASVVEATFEPYPEPRTITIFTVIDTEIEMLVPGVLKFTIDEKPYELLPTLETLDDKRFFIIFKDQTSGKDTYGAGRFLYADRPDETGKVILNFNRAINPPCAYTDYATCPLPPAENWLAVPIEAGERNYVKPTDKP